MGFDFEDVQAESINYNKLFFGSQILLKLPILFVKITCCFFKTFFGF